jgi:hypothetical protein
VPAFTAASVTAFTEAGPVAAFTATGSVQHLQQLHQWQPWLVAAFTEADHLQHLQQLHQ